MSTHPNDEDGQVLAHLAAHGIDLTRPLLIEFSVYAPDEGAANAIQAALAKAGYDTEVCFDEGEPDEDGEIDPDDEEMGPSWTVNANVKMVPEYNEIMRIQQELEQLAAPFGGEPDGWGAMVG